MVKSLIARQLAALMVSIFACVGVTTLLLADEENSTRTPAEFEWNVMLGDWQVLGPIARLNRNDSELKRQLVADEPSLRPDKAVTITGKQYSWRRWPRRIVTFPSALNAEGEAAQYALAYATTTFASDRAQDAILGISHDDGAVVWLNGKEIYRQENTGHSKLDQAAIKVSLQEGANTLLAKVSQGGGNWEFAVRLRPAGLEQPLITLYCDAVTRGDISRLPILELDLLDSDGNPTETWRTSGGRAQTDAIYYTLFAKEPASAPANMRIRYNEPGLAPFEKTVPWSQARSGNALISLKIDAPLPGRVVDEKTGEPVSGAEFRTSDGLLSGITDGEGRFELRLQDPLVESVEIVAAGYEPRQAHVAWPPSEEWTIKLAPGGHVLRGRVLSSDGKPLEGAAIHAYTTGRNLSLTSDADGRFEVIGLPRSRNSLYPTVTHPDYVAKDGFNLPLDADGLTEVEWRLETGAVVTGRVTTKDDGRPVAGIVVTAGNDRFSSNRVNPNALTDADGRYKLAAVKPGPTLVHVIDDSFAPAMQQVNAAVDTPATADFVLEQGEPVTGRIVDPNGKPIPGVTLAIDTWNGARMLNRRVNTNANGEFRFENMPPSPAEIHMFKREYVSKRDLQAVAGEHYEITMQPVVEHTVRIRLSDQPNPPAQITMQKGYLWQGRDEVSWNDVEDYNNEAKYDATAGVVRIRVDEPSTAKNLWRFRVPGYRDAIVDNPEAGARPQSLEALLERTQSATGRVVSAETGEPLDGVMVALVSKQDRLRMDHYVEFDNNSQALERFTGVQATSAADGSFELPKLVDGAEGVDLLLFHKGNGFHYIRDARSLLASGNVELPLPKSGGVEGRVIVAGKPVAESEVHLAWGAGGPEENEYDLPFGFGGQLTTGADGRFRFSGLGPGRYKLSPIRSFKNPLGGGSMSAHLSGEELIVLPGETVTRDINRPAGHTVTGQTVTAEGKPLSNCMVSVSSGAPHTDRVEAVMSDADGRFTVPHLQPGSYSLTAEQYELSPGAGLGRDGAYGSATVKVAGDTTVTIKLAPRAQGQTYQVRPGGPSTFVGTIAPDITGKLFNGDGSFQLSDHFGKVVLIGFWASWGGSDTGMMTEMKKLHEKFKDSKDVQFVTVNLDQDVETLSKAIKEHGVEFPVIYESAEKSQAIASAFGPMGFPSAIVIGRDGRFASERINIPQLASAAETALKAPSDPAFADGGKPAQLTVKLALDTKDSGLPGATITLKAISVEGKTVREETIRSVGPAKQFTWHYAPLSGGEIEVKVETAGMEPQERIILEPEANAEVAFLFTSPRSITGTVSADDGATPVPGMKVTAYRQDGFHRVATTNADGSFQIPALPGVYSLILLGTDDFAAVNMAREQIDVTAESELPPVELAACRAVTVTGTVTDEDGIAVAGAEVRSAVSQKSAKTDDAGRFELPGVPSQGSVQLYAVKQPKYATITLEDFDGKEPQTLVLGQQMGRGPSRLSSSSKIPASKFYALPDGKPINWQPPSEKETLVVFCAFWHPQTREKLAKAKAWADEHQVNLSAISIDWSLDQSRRGAEALHDLDLSEIHFAGPGGLEIANDWKLTSLFQSYLVSADGKVRSSPPPGELP